jgi:hypothetical protein
MDVQRYLADEPVQACPPSVRYRLRKFARRNRGPVLAAATVVLTLIVGVIGTKKPPMKRPSNGCGRLRRGSRF